jgi:hypothetical protein
VFSNGISLSENKMIVYENCANDCPISRVRIMGCSSAEFSVSREFVLREYAPPGKCPLHKNNWSLEALCPPKRSGGRSQRVFGVASLLEANY